MEMPVFRVEELKVRIGGRYVIDEVSFDIHGGEVLALVGESGSGKTLTGLAAMDLLPESSRREKGRIFLEGTDIFTLRKEAKRRIRGKEISMVFQEPFTAMNPVMRVGSQIQEALDAHFDMPRADSSKLICDIIRSVRLDQVVLNSYPHELSGGMRQRAMIAMALVLSPRVLILDEPTTALDVPIQKEILDLILFLQKERKFATLFITHDFSVVNMIADRVAVMKDGRIIETGTREEVLRSPREKYTRKLIDCVPRIGDKRRRLTADG